MPELSGAEQFTQLLGAEQVQYRLAAQQAVRLAQGYAVPIIISRPISQPVRIKGGSGCCVELACGCFVVTASHVLAEYETRIREMDTAHWLVGALEPFDPLPRIAWRNEERDIVFLRVSAEEARRACGDSSFVVSAYSGWPIFPPSIGQPVLVAGYPGKLREVDAAPVIGAGPYSAMFRVTSSGPGYFYCQIEQNDLVGLDGNPLPARYGALLCRDHNWQVR